MSSKTYKYLTPCEVTVKRIIPAIRAALSMLMVKKYGMSIYDVSKALGITPAAVSNYISGKRGEGLALAFLEDEELRSELEKLASKFYNKEGSIDDIVGFIRKICKEAIEGKLKNEKIVSEYSKVIVKK